MRLAHGRAGWVLAAAGSFTLALSSMAQQPKPATAAKPVADKAATEVEISPATSRLVEIKVELAWLGDPATFPCQLAARKVGSKLEVGGFVPDELLRKKAMDLARGNCELPVVDKIVVHPGSAMPIAKAAQDDLSRAATAVLGRTLAVHAEPFSFETDDHGVITISGLIPSWEDKLTVSRRISQLPGCTGVVNHFRVRNQVRDGKVCNLVSIDGKLRIPAATNAVADGAVAKPAVFQEVVQRVEAAGTVPLLPTESPTTTAKGMPVLPPQSLPAPVASKPVVLPPVATRPAAMPTVASKPVVTPTVANKTFTPAIAPVVAVSKDAGPARVASKDATTVVSLPASKPLPLKPVPTANTTLPAGSPYAAQPAQARTTTPVTSGIQQVSFQTQSPTPSSTPAKPVGSPYGGSPYGGSPYSGNLGNAKLSTSSTAPLASPTTKTSPTSQVTPASRVTPAAPVQVAQATSLPSTVTKPATPVTALAPTAPVTATPVARPVAPRIENQAPAVLPSNVVSAPAVQPTSGAVVKPLTAQAPAATIKPVTAPAPVATVVPAAGQRPATTWPVPPVTGSDVQAHLFQRIEEVGAGKIRDIRIQSLSSDACVIHIAVANATDGQEVGKKVINLPELVPYKVDLQVRIQP